MLRQDLSKKLHTSKNLLAFSSGVDSSALFFILLHADIKFDIAIVDYNQRASSKEEVLYAKELASRYGKKIFTHSTTLGTKDFENSARKVRYDFFEEIIKTENYDTLLTAHQLNDKLEWFLMRLTSGAGISSLVGMRDIDERDGYTTIRPLLHMSRDEILRFLKSNNIKYFEDESNLDTKFTRNKFRHKFSNELISNYSSGIKKSFHILEQESNSLYDKNKIFWIKQLGVAKFDNNLELLFFLDVMAKKLGVLLSFDQKQEFSKTNSAVLSGKLCAEIQDGLLFVAPYIKTKLDKEFKERARLACLPVKCRGYAFENSVLPAAAMDDIYSFFGI